VSSIAALGKAEDGGEIDEDGVWDEDAKHSVYAASKYLSEDVVWQIIDKGLNAVIINPGVILGVADDANNSMKIFSSSKNGMPIYTNGGTGYISVQDVCRAMIELTESDINAERFSLVSENLSNRDLLNMIAKKLNKRPPFIKGTKLLLYPIAIIIELFAFLMKCRALIDRGTVKVVLNRSYYSSKKIKKAIGFKFTPIKKCVDEVCDSIFCQLFSLDDI
jgi:dihydroflavonol-4-reductase